MQAIRKVVSRKDIQVISIPESFGDQVEIIVLPATEAEPETRPGFRDLAALQAKTGFATRVLNETSEDVWNDL